MNPAALLREARRSAGLSQEDLAARAGCAQSTLARVEAGLRAPSFRMLTAALAACGLQMRIELEPLDAHLDREIEAVRTHGVARNRRDLSTVLLRTARDLTQAEVAFAVGGVSAAILHGAPVPFEGIELLVEDDVNALGRMVVALQVHRPGEQLPSDMSWAPRPLEPLTLAELRDPFARFEMGRGNVPLRLRMVRDDPRAGSINISIEDDYETSDVPVVPLHALALPPRIGAALERLRRRLAESETAAQRASYGT